MKKIKLKKDIFIGEDSFGPLIRIDIYKDKNNYNFIPIILHDNEDKNLNILKDNLTKIISISEEYNKININLNISDTTRNLGYIENNKYIENIPLTNTEIRMLSLGNIKKGNVFSNDKEIPYVTTDLHTHFTGVLNAKDVYEIAMKVNPRSVKFKTSFLLEQNIINQGEVRDEFVDLYTLNKLKGFKEKLINKMEIKPYKQITFTDMDIIYDLRGPFFASSDPKLFESYVLKMGESYKEKGVKYVELAASSKMFRFINQKDFDTKHKIFSASLEKVKDRYGVDINLLIANPRSKTTQSEIEQFLTIVSKNIRYPYITGIDLLGHEKNSNKLFSYAFASVTRMCAIHDLKHFTIRSHAGETREHKDNVKEFLNGIKQELDYMKENEGLDRSFIPDIRIGHGIYGIDEATISLMKELDAKVEINASSNLALNNIYDLNQIPIRKYIDNSINVVLGTDGQGVYLNDNKQESLIAYHLGVTSDELEKIVEFEKGYIKSKNDERNKRKNISLKNKETYFSENTKIVENLKNYIDVNLQQIETYLDKKNFSFICGMEERNEEDIEILSKDLKIITRNIKNNNQSVLIYDDNSYINEIIEKICNNYNIELIKITSLDENKDGLVYGKDKYEVSKNLSIYFSRHKSDIYVLGGGLFASDLLVNLENEEVQVIYDPRLTGASKEYEERRNNEEREENKNKELIATVTRKK